MYNSFLKPLYRDIKTFFLDTLFPIQCLACEKEGKEFLCSDCAGKLPKVHQICIICKKPSLGGLTHPGCKTPFAPDGLISVYDYHDERVKNLIINGKYYFVSDIYKTLGKLLADEIKLKHHNLLNPYPFTLAPIPLHKMRLNWRGFNQAEVLCIALTNNLQLSTNNYLVRSKWTRTQKNLKKDDRKQNIDNVFSVSPNLKSQIQNQKFLLIDDVTTTGSTLLEAVKVLKRNGAKEVWAFTVARD